MKDLRIYNSHRVRGEERYGWPGYPHGGTFIIHCKLTARDLRVIASAGDGWDHVSVSLPTRCPNWLEMDFIKRLFFEDFELAVQFHVPVKDHINIHDHVLHLWRNHNQEIQLPPFIMV